MLAKAVRDYFEKSCPLFADRKIGLYCIDDDTDAVSVKLRGEPFIVKHYPCGASLRQFTFTVSFRLRFDGDPTEGEKAAAFAQELIQWVQKSDLPKIDEGECIRLEAEKLPYLETSGEAGGRLCIDMRLLYEI